MFRVNTLDNALFKIELDKPDFILDIIMIRSLVINQIVNREIDILELLKNLLVRSSQTINVEIARYWYLIKTRVY